MQRRQGRVTVNQRIEYNDSKQKERYHIESDGELIELQNYSRIAYNNDEGEEIIVKWQGRISDNSLSIEIRQANYTLVFQNNQPFIASYPTPQGLWELEVQTLHFKVEQTDDYHIAIEIDYQIKLNDQPIANYEFRLIYQ